MQAGDGTGTKGHTVPKHVWVAVDGRWHEPRPGILVEWRRTPAGYEGLVAWFSGGGNIAWSGRHQWLLAGSIREAKVEPPQP